MSQTAHASAQWIYRGIWKVLTDLFRVPREPTDLPVLSGEFIVRFRPSDGYLRYMKTVFWIVLLITDIAIAGGYAALAVVCVVDGLWWLAALLLPVALALIIVPDIIAYVAIHLRFDTTWYVMTDRSLRVRRGVYTIREATITFENVQNVKVRQGPLQRHFGIANLIVETAGGGGAPGGNQAGAVGPHTGVIEGVSNAAELRDRILARLRSSQSAGLGDEELASAEAGRAIPMSFSPAHLDALRAIRDEIRAMRVA